MPVFDWTRTELARKRPDGSTVLAYTQEAVDAINPEDMFASISGDMNGTVMPGWEPERMAKIKDLFAMYKDIDDEKLFKIFLRENHACM
jgi:mannonate dehydratase